MSMRFGISARLGLGFGFLVALMSVLTWTSISEVNSINKNLGRINDVNSVKQRFAINYRGSVHDRAIAKASQFSDAQKVSILKQGDNGVPVTEICRKAGTPWPSGECAAITER